MSEFEVLQSSRAASPLSNLIGGASVDPATLQNSSVRAAAEKFEASFLAEMLKHAGVAKMPEAFNGGPGEAAFSGFLVQEYADAISSSRSFGLADHVYRAMLERMDT
ncbi:MAG: rod-binding protein [Pseudomonadota bacterium]